MTSELERHAAEDSVRVALEAGDHGDATRQALGLLGEELLRYLVALSHDASLAEDAFSLFCEHLWRGLPDFRWQSSLRTWCYVLARNALRMILREPHRRRHLVPLSDPAVAEVAEVLRSTTALYLQTELKDAVARLRGQLDPIDQDILVLRIGRQMSWLDIAQVVMGGESELDSASLKREAARLRKRFERSKAALKALVEKAGLVDVEQR